LLRIKNRLIDAPDASGGFRNAVEAANEVLPLRLRDDPAQMQTTTASRAKL